MGRPCVTREPSELAELHARYAATHDPALRGELVEAYSDLVRSVARRFDGRGESFEDLVQVGFVGLLQAIERFDPGRGFPFIAFALPTMVGELKKHFRDRRWRMRVSRDLQERYLEVRAARDRLVQTLGRIPSTADIGEELGITADDVVEALEVGSTFAMASLEGGRGERDPGGRCREDGYDAVDDRLFVDALLATLPGRHRDVVWLRFNDELTQAEIGRRVGMGQMQVSRLLSRTLRTLRDVATCERSEAGVPPRRSSRRPVGAAG
jgi:RNA polymerase sigma-B factor